MIAPRALLLVLAAAGLLSTGCGRKADDTVSRTAVLPFENLTPDRSLDWMEPGTAEILSDQLSSAPRTQALATADRAQAAALGATRFLGGYFSVSGGRLRLSAWLQNGPSGKIAGVASAEGSAKSGIIPLLDRVARQLEPSAQAYATQNEAAFRAFLEARQTRDPEAAAASFERAVKLDPGFGSAYIWWVQTALARQDRGRAQQVFEMARAAAPRLREVDRLRLELDEASLRNDAAARSQALASLTRLRPTDPAVWRTVAETELSARRLPQAVEAYRKLARFDPQNAAALNTLGYTEAIAGNLNQAVDALERYIRLQPDQANPLDSLGDVYFHFGRMTEAEKYYKQSFEKAPAGAGVLSLEKAAHARLYRGDVDGADSLFNQFLDNRRRQGDPAVEYRRAVWLYLSGRRQPGMQGMESLAGQARVPQLKSQAEAQLAIWYLERGDRAGARRAAEAAAGTPLGAVVQFMTGPPAPASEWAVRAERSFPDPAQERMKRFALGYALLLAGHFDAAAPLWREIYRQSNPLSPEGSEVLLAWALIESGRWDGVEDLIARNPIPAATGPSPFASLAFPRVLDLRARLLEKQGETGQAAETRKIFERLSAQS